MLHFNTENTPFDFVRGFVMDMDRDTGKSLMKDTTKRYLSDMRGMYMDDAALEALCAGGKGPLVYEFHELDVPRTGGDLAYGCSIIYPGDVGGEYFMTKGHFHSVLMTGEVYYCLSGGGYMMLEDTRGDWSALAVGRGQCLYVPPGYAHRAINTGAEPLVIFYAFRADAGHDYASIETKGFRHVMLEKDGAPQAQDNPKWRE